MKLKENEITKILSNKKEITIEIKNIRFDYFFAFPDTGIRKPDRNTFIKGNYYYDKKIDFANSYLADLYIYCQRNENFIDGSIAEIELREYWGIK